MDKFELIFNNIPAAIWEEDFSKTKEVIDAFIDKHGYPAFLQKVEDVDFLKELVSTIKIIRVNKRVLALYHAKDMSELIPITTTFNAESLRVFKEEIIAVANSIEAWESECETLTLSGEKIYCTISWKISNNDFSSVLVSMVDITHEKDIEKKLSNINEKYKNLIESTQTSYVILDEKLSILETNAVFEKMMGYPKEYFKGLPIWKLFPQNDIQCEKALCILTSCSYGDNGNKPVEIELVMMGNCNSLKWVNMTANGFSNGCTKVFCLIRDISDKKKTELVRFIEKQKQKDKLKQNINKIRNCLQNMGEQK